MMIQSNGPVSRPVSSARMRSDASSSDGFAGVRPAVIVSRFGSCVRCTTSRMRAWPASNCDRPRSLVMRSALCTLGRRMSASISSTRAPPTASAIAMLTAVVVLPSSGCELADRDDARAVARQLRGERGANRAIRFAEVVRHRTGDQRMPLAGDDRHQAEELAASAGA